jgi:hypothetical protein
LTTTCSPAEHARSTTSDQIIGGLPEGSRTSKSCH